MNDTSRDSRQQQLEKLILKRRKLQVQLQELDRTIADLGGTASDGAPPAATDRAPNDRTLREYVVEILTAHPAGLSLNALAHEVQAAGYHSNSQNFRNVLYQCVYNTKDVFHDETTGTYRLKSLAAREFQQARSTGP